MQRIIPTSLLTGLVVAVLAIPFLAADETPKIKKIPAHATSAISGQELFREYCAVCHGMTAAGDGITKQYGLATVISLQDERIRKMADGEIFNTITNGKNTMLAYGPNVIVTDRWAIIAYLRALQRSQNATEADVPPEHRAELDKPAETKAEPKPEAPKK